MTRKGKASIRTIDQAEMVDMFAYCQTTGNLYWKETRGSRAKAGGVAGCLRPSGYRHVKVNDVLYKEHRVIWVMHFGDIPAGLHINHKDENKSNNRLSNLELVTQAQNNAHGTRTARQAAALKGKKQTPQHIARHAAAVSKPIYCHETTTVYHSIKLAAEQLGVHATNISAVLNGKLRHTGNFTFSWFI